MKITLKAYPDTEYYGFVIITSRAQGQRFDSTIRSGFNKWFPFCRDNF